MRWTVQLHADFLPEFAAMTHPVAGRAAGPGTAVGKVRACPGPAAGRYTQRLAVHPYERATYACKGKRMALCIRFRSATQGYRTGRGGQRWSQPEKVLSRAHKKG